MFISDFTLRYCFKVKRSLRDAHAIPTSIRGGPDLDVEDALGGAHVDGPPVRVMRVDLNTILRQCARVVAERATDVTVNCS